MFTFETFEDKFTLAGLALVAWTLLWVIIRNFFITTKKITEKERMDLQNRIVSMTHGLIILSMSAYIVFVENPEYEDVSTKTQHYMLIISGAYFLYDLLACIYYGLADLSLVLHHGLCILGIIVCEATDNGTTSTYGLFYAEASNAPMHLRCILRTLKMRYTKFYEFNELLYITVYIVARGFFSSIMAYRALPNAAVPWFIRFCCFGIWLQSGFFIKEMFVILQKKKKQFIERQKKGVSYEWFTESSSLEKLSYYRKEGRDKIF
mmetsp:Transcript_9079/g.7998  ORF Transcript_9079/g.7998 Transcript_9079/m.7998 type:complete len:264 (+) Transcript_9079:64-855(+)